MEKVEVFNLEIGDLFSFRKNSAVHMIARKTDHIEYKSYNDGKIRIINKNDSLDRPVYPRPEWDIKYNDKWFVYDRDEPSYERL